MTWPSWVREDLAALLADAERRDFVFTSSEELGAGDVIRGMRRRMEPRHVDDLILVPETFGTSFAERHALGDGLQCPAPYGGRRLRTKLKLVKGSAETVLVEVLKWDTEGSES